MRFIRNIHLDAELRRDPKFRMAMRQQAERVKSHVEKVAPRGGTGDYAASLEVVETAGSLAVATTDFAGHIVEWGSKNNPPYAPLRRGTRAAGLRFDEQ